MANNSIHSSFSSRSNLKLIEKNRGEEIKALFSRFHSLVPNQREGETMLSDQIGNATNYIKQLRENVEKLKEKNEKLMGLGEESTMVQVEAHQLLQENGTEIVHINRSTVTDRIFHKISAQMVGEGMNSERAKGERIYEIVKKFVSQYKDGQNID